MRIGIIGFGHLGKALAKGLIYKNIVSKHEIYILAKSESTKEIAENEFGVQVCNDINDIIKNTEILFWVLKGKVFNEICKDIQQDITLKINISFMAGLTIKSIHERLGNVYITRAMPSIAIDRANGIIGYTKTKDIYVIELFDELGFAFEVEEKDIEKVTAFSSCGLGFAAYILNAFQTAGQTLGFSSDVSKKIVAKTFGSALEMEDYKETVNAVATKGGATEQGINHFEENDMNGIVYEAMNKAYMRMK